ncbi:MAG: amino acid adenylation domain-containing protein, partial [bacterium]|nr:amino acid adenylation domain-containing protein [bacterium]
SPLDIQVETAKFDLTLNLQESAAGITGFLEYNTDLFDRATISRMAGHLVTLLAGLVSAPSLPDCPLSQLTLLTRAEAQQLLSEWTDTGSPPAGPQEAIHQRFEAQVAKTPEAVAVVFAGEQVSYRELNRRANRLAYRLRDRGVGPEVLVGICMERSLEMVVGILGILKAGGAYVPIDPSYPRERSAFMLEDAGIGVLLSQEQPATTVSLPVSPEIEVVRPDSERQDPPFVPLRGNPGVAVSPDNLAYVIYTSGSTGKPKGSLISHRNVVRLFTVTERLFRFDAADVWTLFHSYAFDFSVWELWGALAYGGRLVVVPYLVSRSPDDFCELLIRQAVTILNQTPSAFRQLAPVLAKRPAGREGMRLRRVIFGGEALEPSLLKPWFERFGDRRPRLVNMYGITETTVHVTYHPLAQAELRATMGSPIGGPLADLPSYLLDRRGNPVPVGVPGEIHVGGAGLGRGYLNRPGLSAQRFVPAPFGRHPGERLYRTGDLARYLPNGALDFLGRIDHQVKIRGHRIEVGEIEAVLTKSPSVRECVVLMWEKTPGDRRLVAYVAGDRDRAPAVRELRSHLKEKLPEYMVPAAFVLLESLPLTAGGKLDRKALPAPDQSRPQPEDALVAPRTPVEETLARIWSQVLSVDQVGADDNFFDLGGDSILGIQVVAKAQEAGLRLTPKDLFQSQTIAELAAVAGTAPPAEADQGAATGEVPLTPIQRWLLERNLPEVHHFNQAVLLEVRQEPDLLLLERALAVLTEHHDALRLRFFREEGGWRQLHAASGGAVPLIRIDLSALPEEPQGAALADAAAELQASLDLSRAPLWRVALLDLGPDKGARLLWLVHHLAVDGVSWRILLEDLDRIYRQIERGDEMALPPRTSSFKNWARRLEDYARSENLKGELAYWLAAPRALAGPLPVDSPGGVNTMASARIVTAVLEVDQTRSLLQEVPAAYHTQINDVLLTALVQALARWTGAATHLVDLEGHGREELFAGVELSRTVGWFTVIYPVLLDLGTAWGPGEELMAVKEQLRAVPNGGIGYGLLRYLGGDRETVEKLCGLPGAEVSFNYLGQLDPVLSHSSLLRPAPESSGPATGSGGLRTHLLEINGGIADSRLRMNWTFSENLHHRSTVEALAASFLETLRGLIRHCLSPEAGAHTPADFPEARLGQKDLDKLFGQIKRSGGV